MAFNGFYLWRMYVFGHLLCYATNANYALYAAEDRDKFLEEVYIKQKLKVTVVKSEPYDPDVSQIIKIL